MSTTLPLPEVAHSPAAAPVAEPIASAPKRMGAAPAWLREPLPLPADAIATQAHSRLFGWRAIHFSTSLTPAAIEQFYAESLPRVGWRAEPAASTWRREALVLTLKVDPEAGSRGWTATVLVRRTSQ